MKTSLTISLLSAIAFLSFSVPTQTLASGLVHIEQNSSDAEYAEWVLADSSGTVYRSALQSKILQNLPAGEYTVSVRAPVGAKTTITIYETASVVRQESVGTHATFTLNDGDSLRIEFTYSYTGTVEVTSDPPGVPFEMKGANNYHITGVTPAVFTDMPPHWYRVSYDIKADCEAQKNQERGLIQNSTLTFFADFNCGPKPVSLAGKSTDPLGTANLPPPADPIDTHTDKPALKVMQTSSVTETLPGGRVRITINVRNMTRATIRSVTVRNEFDPNTTDIFLLDTDAAIVGSTIIEWNVPEIYAGQVWSGHFEVRARDTVVAGDRMTFTARAEGENVAGLFPEALSDTIGIGIAYLPETGERFDLLLSLAALIIAALITLSHIRQQQSVALRV